MLRLNKKMHVKIVLLIFILQLLTHINFGQNLVKNPSFEDFVNPSEDIYFAKDWIVPNEGTIDYYSEKCSQTPKYISFTNMCYSTNNTWIGYNQPLDGIAYIGFLLFGWNGGMEHYTGVLVKPLIKDSTYDISFYIKYGGDLFWIYSKKIEILLTNDQIKSNYNTYLPNFGLINNLKATITMDIQEAYKTRDWIRCSAKYKARGGEKFITFGLFNQQDNSKLVKLTNEYNKKSNDYEWQINFVNNHDIFPIAPNINCKQHKKNRDNTVYAYYFLDAVSVTLGMKGEVDFTLPLK